MSTFRVAASSMSVGVTAYLLSVFHTEVPRITMELLRDPEFWVAIGLLVVVAIFLMVRVPAMAAKMLDARSSAIAKELDEARRLREEAATLLAGYAKKVENAESEAAQILADARAEADRFAKEVRTQLRTQIDRRAQMARDRIEQAEAAALADIRNLAADKATAAAEKLIADRMDEKRDQGLVDQSILELTDKLN